MFHKFCLLIQLLLSLMVLVCTASMRHLRSGVRRGIFVKWWLLFFHHFELRWGYWVWIPFLCFFFLDQTILLKGFRGGSMAWEDNKIWCPSPTGISPVSQWPKSRSKYFREVRWQAWLFLLNLFFFWWGSMTFRILVSQPGIEPVSPAVEAWSLNHWITREVPVPLSFNFNLLYVNIFITFCSLHITLYSDEH